MTSSLRVQKGICYHLYSRARESLLEEYPLPEIQRTRLEEIILHIKILKLGSVRAFLSKVLMPPDTSVVEISLKVSSKLCSPSLLLNGVSQIFLNITFFLLIFTTC